MNSEFNIPYYLVNSQVHYVLVSDLTGKYLYTNQLFLDKFGFIADNFVGKSSLIDIYPEDHETCQSAGLKCLENPGTTIQLNLRKPDRSLSAYYWTSWEFSAMLDSSGAPVGVLCIGHDITDSQYEAQKSIGFAKKLDEVYEEISDGFYQLDQSWNFTKANKKALDILGVTKKDLIGNNIWELFSEHEGYKYPVEFTKAMSQLTTVAFREYFPPLDSWYKTVAYPAPEGLNVYFTDVTDEMKQYEKLIEAEKRLKAIYESTDDIHLFIDFEFKILYFNKVAQEISTQYAGKRFDIGADYLDYLLQEDKDLLKDSLPNLLNGKSKVFEISRNIGGTIYWFEKTYSPIYYNEELIGIGVNLKNITKKKLADNRLIEQDYILNAIYNSTTEASSFIDTSYKIKYLNKVAKDITRKFFGKEAKVGDNLSDFVLPEYLVSTIEKYIRAIEGEIINEEMFDGKTWWQISYSPVYNSEDEIIGIAYNIKDITDRKEKEIFIRRQNEQLKKIAWIQSHELRKPVANILGLSELLKSEKDIQALRQMISDIELSVKELDQTIHKIVNLASESGKDDDIS